MLLLAMNCEGKWGIAMNWQQKPLGDIIQFKNGKKRPAIEGTVPVYGGNGILGYANDSNYNQCIIIGRVGAYCGSVYYEENACWVSDNAIAAQPKNGTDIHFAYYLLKSLNLNERHIGTSQPLLTQEILNRIECRVPPLQEQAQIASVLSALDDKIKINDEINDNLQQQANLIFQQELLQNGDLPESWSMGCLLDIANYLNGLAMQRFRPDEGETGLPVLKIKELRQGFCDASSELCSPNIKAEYVVHDGDVIFSWSGSLLVDFWCGGICGLNQHLFKVTSNQYPKWFYYAWTVHHLARFVAIAADKATTMGHIKREELAKAEVVIPDSASMERIGELLQPVYDLIISNRIENRKLASLRDVLLRKLMSGEIDVSTMQI